ncbi:MAG: HAD hydrolase family protein [Candidatus Aegiribacteria sp.]|nr:HAD hydrolase family protein [Candidatus Aegiribacteria sp.]MBD3293969.1 HAD hydrolase family protein [Candidatus Fermentibacteria bacterium]
MRELEGIGLLALDVDGTLTDGGLFYGPAGVTQKFNSKDGFGIIRLRRMSFPVAFVSYRDFPATRRRARDLGVDLLCLGSSRKAEALEGLCSHLGIDCGEALFMGDGLMDIPAMELAGVAACPADARSEVRARCDIVTDRKGGDGAVGELIDLLLEHIDHG